MRLWKFCSCRPQSQTTLISYLSGSPRTSAGQGRLVSPPERAIAVKTLLLTFPITDITPLPHSTASEMLVPPLGRAGLRPAPHGTGSGWLLARAGYVSPCCNVMCLWYMCFCAEVFFFSVLRLYSKWSIVWGLKIFFFPSLSSCKKLYFLNTLSPVLSTPLSYVCCVCMDRLMANFAGYLY